ncbi:hypothetical protein BO82DRAFT_399365 [Aspergillus uvarum CBS 121591]|uniref:Rhodopsin domain-containing protein n=1 Tax=Aspergillus uvarum CBS 121591 TaxID=1448315 RepID=A0A319CJ99_9EURO|nr:hypothetical protein BO82DRAFT_399365 [Aspergillus uvarum CBS 121591]PYH84530.1 hypothetical protein BO82DRAFT_399365 [Aspergillus uvarum CBS 121591]
MTRCGLSFAVLIALTASDVAVDLIILAIPLALVLSLHLDFHKRNGIIVVLLMGSMARACGIARMSLFARILGPKLLSTQTVGSVSSSDDIGIVSILMFWGMSKPGGDRGDRGDLPPHPLPAGARRLAPCAPTKPAYVSSDTRSKDDGSSFLDGAEVQPGQSAPPRRFYGLGSILKSVDDNAAMKLSLGFTGERGAEWPQMRNQSTIALPMRMHAVTTDAVLNAQQHPPRSQIWEIEEIPRTVEVA